MTEEKNICKLCIHFDGFHCLVSFEDFPKREKCFYFDDGKNKCPSCSSKSFVFNKGNFVCEKCGYTEICEESEF